MKTTERTIKEKTIKKCLAVLREMKYRADNNLPMHIKEITKKYRTAHTIPHATKLLHYFESEIPNKWICKKERFDPIDARHVLTFIYDYYEKQHKEKSNIKNQPKDLFPLADVKEEKMRDAFIPPHIKQVEEYCNLRKNNVNPAKWYNFYASKDWMVGDHKMKNWKNSIIVWENSNYNIAYYKGKLNEYLDNEIFDEAKKRGYLGEINKYSDEELIQELKERGYSGNMRKYIEFESDEIIETSEEESKTYTVGKKNGRKK